MMLARSKRTGNAATRQFLAEKLTGMVLATMLPALLWVGALAAVAPAFGRSPSLAALALTETAISLFLVLVCAPIMWRPR